MSATANLFLPEIAIWEGEPEPSSPFSPIILDGARQDDFEQPDQTGACEAIVNHYESRLNAADGAILHLGAGRGELMETLRQHGFAVMGCELSPRPTRLAREAFGFEAHTLHCSSTEHFLRWVGRIGHKVQAVFFRHGWEHNLELQALLPRLAEIVSDGGRVIALLPPPDTGYTRETHLSFVHELATACTSCNERFDLESVDGDSEGRFMAFVLKKSASPHELIILS